MRIRIGITEYGNLGRGVECTAKHNPDMESKAVSTRRMLENVKILTPRAKAYHADEAVSMKDEIDVLILYGGNSTDSSTQTPELAKYSNVVDSFDTYARAPEHSDAVDGAAKENGHMGIISVGWNPGIFSLNRLYASTTPPGGRGATFWGKGVSQGHSDAIRRIDGVKDARQYTAPVESTLEAIWAGENPELTAREKHMRERFMVAEESMDLEQIEREIVTMPNYPTDYDVTVHFISKEGLTRDHVGIPHGGVITRSGKTGWEDENSHVTEYSSKLDFNPEFTTSVIVTCARVAYRLNQEGQASCKTISDIAPAYPSAESGEELRRRLL